MVRVVLVSPPSPYRDTPDPSGIPLGLIMLASSVKNLADVTIIDGYSAALTPYDIRNEVDLLSPDLVGISIPFTFIENQAVELARAFKEDNPDLKIIVGGLQASINYRNLVKSSLIDGVVVGEGEAVFANLVNFMAGGGWESVLRHRPDGLAVEQFGKISFVEHPLALNLDNLPVVDYGLRPNLVHYNSMRVETSRGCGFKCPYCSTSSYWCNAHREYSISRVRGVIDYINEEIFNRISIADDTFNFNPKRARNLCIALSTTRLEGVEIGVSCRPELLTEEDLRIYKKGRINSIFLGLESGSPKILKILKRAHDPVKTRDLIKSALACGIDIHASFMIGLPGETRDDIEQTLAYAESLPTSNIGFHIYHPLPGSEFGDNMEKYGLEYVNADVEGLGAIGSVAPINTGYLSAMEISDYYDRAINLVRYKKEGM